jgi:hypothetical protein
LNSSTLSKDLLHRGTKKIFFGALVFRPVSGVIWDADSEKCIGLDRISSSFLDMVEYIKF